MLKLFILILTILFLGLPLSALDQHKTYLQDQYPAIKKIHETKAKSIRKLIEKIIHEAKIKNIPPVMVNEFLTLQKTNFKTLEKKWNVFWMMMFSPLMLMLL